MHLLWQDFRFATRRLLKQPGFSGLALIVLAIGISSTTTLFSVVKAVLLDPLPFAEPDRIVVIQEIEQPAGKPVLVSGPSFLDYQEGSQSWAALGVSRFGNFNLTGAAEPQQIRAAHVSPDFFDVFGLDPVIGRTFSGPENGAQPPPAVILGHSLWQLQFGGRDTVVGQTVRLDSQPHVVVGVMPAEMNVPDYADLWMPLGDLSERPRDQRDLAMVGRMKRGIDIDTAQAEMSVLRARRLAPVSRVQKTFEATVTPLLETLVGDSRTVLQALLAAVGGVLLIACLNIATLQTVRGLDRHRDVAVRTAFGADRLRVFREQISESVLLGCGGGVLGILLTTWSLDLLIALAPTDIQRLEEATIDWSLQAFAMGLSILVGVLFGLVPALQSTRLNVVEALKKGTGTRNRRAGGFDLRARMVVAQVALTFVLLVGAGLLVKSLHELWSVEPGFDVDRLVSFGLVLPKDQYPETHQVGAFIRDATESIRSLPEVENASAINFAPFSYSGPPIEIEIDRPSEAQVPIDAASRTVATDYFTTLGIPLIKGRSFTHADDPASPAVVMINETLAQQWPGGEPVGAQIRLPRTGREPVSATVVGVVGDMKHGGLAQTSEAAVYRPHAQEVWRYMNLIVRASEGPPERLIPAVQQAIWKIDPERPLFAVAPLSQASEQQIARPRFSALLTGVFSLFALLLAAVGLYSVLAFSVSQRSLELGVRLAFGAEGKGLKTLIVNQGMRLVVIGLSLGLVASLAVSRLLDSLLFGVGAQDPTTYIVVPVVLITAAYLASYLPAHRASRVDPMVVLREQ